MDPHLPLPLRCRPRAMLQLTGVTCRRSQDGDDGEPQHLSTAVPAAAPAAITPSAWLSFEAASGQRFWYHPEVGQAQGQGWGREHRARVPALQALGDQRAHPAASIAAGLATGLLSAQHVSLMPLWFWIYHHHRGFTEQPSVASIP